MPCGAGEAHDPPEDRVVLGMGGVAEFLVQPSVEPVRCGFLVVDLADQIAYAEPGRGGADGKRVDSFPACLQVFDPRENDLGSRELCQVRLWHNPRVGTFRRVPPASLHLSGNYPRLSDQEAVTGDRYA
jgi:hypothetical protein